jgi:superfamily II DNA helicase RecQ
MDLYDDVIIDAMDKALGYTPHPFQHNIIKHIIRMKSSSSATPTKPILLVQGTGGGKSSVYQCVGVIKRGVSLIIQNTLSLSSDQLSKIDKISQRLPRVYAIQLDSIKELHQQNLLIATLSSLSSTTNCTFYLFASPECLIKQPWQRLIDTLIHNEVLKFVCFDEVHLFVSFGISFRPNFIRLKELLFEKLRLRGTAPIQQRENTGQSTTLKIPILFMTATFNDVLLKHLEKMTGLSIKQDCFHWSGCNTFQRRNIQIAMSFTSYKTKIIKALMKDHLETNINSKAIVYSSVAKSTEKIQDTLDMWLDDPLNVDGDTILINGDLEPEWKFVSTQCFTETNLNPAKTIEDNCFYPRILIATSGCIGAGLDCADVNLVVRDGFPSSLLDMIQEMGRCGRGVCPISNNKKDGFFHMILNVESFTYLIERMYEANSDDTDEDRVLRSSVVSVDEYRKLEYNNLINVLRLVFLQLGCWHVILEQSCSSTTTEELTPCQLNCPYCNKSMESYIMQVRRVGLIAFLIDTFIRRSDSGSIDIK